MWLAVIIGVYLIVETLSCLTDNTKNEINCGQYHEELPHK